MWLDVTSQLVATQLVNEPVIVEHEWSSWFQSANASATALPELELCSIDSKGENFRNMQDIIDDVLFLGLLCSL